MALVGVMRADGTPVYGVASDYDGIRAEAQTKIRPGTAEDRFLFKKILSLFNKTWRRRVRIRHLSLSCPTSPKRPVQGSLFPDTQKPGQSAIADKPAIADEPAVVDKLEKAMDSIRKQFGNTAVQTATALALPCSR